MAVHDMLLKQYQASETWSCFRNQEHAFISNIPI